MSDHPGELAPDDDAGGYGEVPVAKPFSDDELRDLQQVFAEIEWD